MAVDRLAAVFVALGLVLAGCSSGGHESPLGPPPPPAVVVHGVLRMTGGPSDATQPGVPGTVTFESKTWGSTKVTAKADGTFTAQLPPGTYTVTGRSPQYGSGRGLCRTNGDVVVKQGRVGLVTVACDRK